MAQPGNKLGPHMVPGVPWAADNGCFAKKWSPGKWISWLEANVDHIPTCLFATVPDVVGSHVETIRRWGVWAPVVRELGYPLAFVLQDGAQMASIPWGEFDWLFIGGSTEFKLSPWARTIAIQARKRGLMVHMGRVNSKKRCLYASDFCDTVDGTYLAFGPDTNLPKLLNWMKAARRKEAERGLVA